MLLVGSQAVKNHYPDFRNPNGDWDIFATYDDACKASASDVAKVWCRDHCWILTMNSGEIVELHLPDKMPTTDEFIALGKDCVKVDTPVGPCDLATPEMLLAIKRSHVHRPRNFLKHIGDYHFLKERTELTAPLLELSQRRFKETRAFWGDQTPTLNKSKFDFFDDKVVKFYEHDSIHLAIAHYERPLYERCQNNTDVLCSKKLWGELSHDDKIKMVREEGYAIALERILIPGWERDNEDRSASEAFGWATFRICTTLCSGWFRRFALENYPEVMNVDTDIYVKRFNDNRDKLIKWSEDE
jgi:hypothetical protein